MKYLLFLLVLISFQASAKLPMHGYRQIADIEVLSPARETPFTQIPDTSGFEYSVVINAQVFKVGKIVEVNVYLKNANSNGLHPQVLINGAPLPPPIDNRTTYMEKAVELGKHTIKVQISYNLPDGTRKKVDNKLEYEVIR